MKDRTPPALYGLRSSSAALGGGRGLAGGDGVPLHRGPQNSANHDGGSEGGQERVPGKVVEGKMKEREIEIRKRK